MAQDTQAPEIAPSDPITSLYRWSVWVHVGPGADSCEDIDEEAGRNDCGNPLHVHLWCRLPNQFQHREIRERALAAKARRVRQLRDEDSDSFVVLEEEIDTLARMGDSAKPEVVDELVQRDWWRDQLSAVHEVKQTENGKGEKIYEHIEEDFERLAQLRAMPEDERPAEEFAELEKHTDTYGELVIEKREAEAKPRREALEGRHINELLDMLRDQRIDVDSNEAFTHTFNSLQWQICTLTKPNGDRVWATEGEMQMADESVIEAVQAAYQELEGDKQRERAEGGGRGNS